MNNSFIRAALKAFDAQIDSWFVSRGQEPLSTDYKRLVLRDFEERLEAQAKAFDACKTGDQVSMANLQSEMAKAWWSSIKVAKSTQDATVAYRHFVSIMQPHFEARLF